jgi:menaquinone-dependent protoporphyrinogen oxidase
MRVLIVWGSKRGGTKGIAQSLGEELEKAGIDVELAAAEHAPGPAGFDAVLLGGALYANRWHAAARRYVHAHERELQRVPSWFFSSGPLDDSASREEIHPTRQVLALMERVGALGHKTFGGLLDPDEQTPLSKDDAGDFRDPAQIRAFARHVAEELPAKPHAPVPQPARSIPRLVAHGVFGWAACAATMAGLISTTSMDAALAFHALLAPVIFVLVARHYFHPVGAREPLPTAAAFVGIVALLDLVVVAGAVQRSLAMFASVAGTWLPLALIFVATAATGELMSTMPWPRVRGTHGKPHAQH